MSVTGNYLHRTASEVAQMIQEVIWDRGGRDVAYVRATDNLILLEFTNDDTFEIIVNVKA